MHQIVVAGQTPPPVHGQAVMIQKILGGRYKDLELHHVRMAFSRELDEVGRFQFGKLIELVRVVAAIIEAKFRTGAQVLYYPPSGPNRIPVIRDLIILLAVRWLFRSTVFHFHAAGLTGIVPNLSKIERHLFYLAYRRPEIAICMSDAVSEDAIEIGAKDIHVVPYGIEDAASSCREVAGHDDHSGLLGILFVGAVRESKGVSVLLEALKQLRERDVPFHAEIVGGFTSSAYEAWARSFVAGNGMGAQVHFTGVKTGQEKWAAYARADVFCFPTFYEFEAFPVVLVEAQCFGLPIVSTRWRGVPEVVEEGVTALLTDIRDSRAIADALELLATNPGMRARMHDDSRKRYEGNYSLSVYREGIERALVAAATRGRM